MTHEMDVSSMSLVSNLAFVDDNALIVTLSEQLQIASVSTDGYVQCVLSHPSNGKTEEAAALVAAVGTHLTAHAPSELQTHPFFRMIKGAAERSPPGHQKLSSSPPCPSVDTDDFVGSAAGRSRATSLVGEGALSTAFAEEFSITCEPPPPTTTETAPKPQFVEMPMLSMAPTSPVRTKIGSLRSMREDDPLRASMASSAYVDGEFNAQQQPKKPTFHLPMGSGAIVLPSSLQNSPRTVKKASYPATKSQVVAPIRFGCNEVYHPDDAKYLAVVAKGGGSDGTAPTRRPNSARCHELAMDRLYPQPHPASARPPSAKPMGTRTTTRTAQPPLIHYSGLTTKPAFITSDMNRLQPPTYSPRLARPPSAPTFPYQRKTVEMSHKTDKLLQDAVDKATHISSRIVSNIRQRRLVGSNTSGGRQGGDGRVFLTLDQQPIPPELVRAVAMTSASSPRKRGDK
jgi:hypothetical protein